MGRQLMLPVVVVVSVRRVGRVKSVTLRCDTIAAANCGTFHCGKLFKGLEGSEGLEVLEESDRATEQKSDRILERTVTRNLLFSAQGSFPQSLSEGTNLQRPRRRIRLSKQTVRMCCYIVLKEL